MSSSPFEIFRRNLKPLMVFLTLLALFSFVLLPALDTYMRRGGGVNSDPVAATFDGTKLTRNQVGRTTQNHAAVVRFLNELANETINRGGEPQIPGFQYDRESGQIRSLGIDSNPGAQATIDTLRFYNEAQKAGFELDDTSIRTWLTQFTDGTVTDDEIAAMMIRSSGRQLGQQHLYEQLRMHLLADLYQRNFLIGLTKSDQMPVVTPLGQYQNFLKLNQRATVQTYAVLVSEFFDETDENPSQSDINEVYKEGSTRLRYPNDQSPLPAFRRPDSANIEFVGAELEQFVEAEKAKLTEEQIRAEYERRLAGGDFQLPVDSNETETDETETSESPESPSQPAEEQPAEEMPKEEQPKEEMPKEEMPAEEQPTEETPTEETPAEPEPPTETPDAPGEEDSSMDSRRDSAVRLVMLQDEESAPDEESNLSSEQPVVVAPLDSLDLDDAPAPTKPQSFDEVRDQIATELASEPARAALDRAVTEANKRMRQYFSQLAVHESNVAVGVQTAADAPEPLDLEKMAAELGMTYGKTDELVNRVSVGEIGPGQSYGLGSGFNRRGPPYNAMMFGARMQDGSELPAQPVFSPLRSVDLESGVGYVSWKTEDVASYIPELDEVRDEVIEFIRTREARGLAKAAAEDLAAEANEEGKSLADVIPEDKTDNFNKSVGPFSWLEQVGFMQTVPSEVPELDAVGEDFMRAVFTTSEDGIAVAPNDPQSVYYVVKPLEFQPDVEQLRAQFRQPQQRLMAQLLGNEDARNILRGVYESVNERTGFEMKLTEDE